MTRDEAVLSIAKDLCSYYGNCKGCGSEGICDVGISAQVMYDRGYRKQSEWISVRERLPEESGKYLAFTFRGNRMVLDYSERNKTFNSFDCFSTEEANEVAIAVTHWMPLPEPPKGD